MTFYPKGYGEESPCDIIVCKLELLSCYYVHFRIITHEKDMNHISPTAIGYIVSLKFFHKNSSGIK